MKGLAFQIGSFSPKSPFLTVFFSRFHVVFVDMYLGVALFKPPVNILSNTDGLSMIDKSVRRFLFLNQSIPWSYG